MIFYLVIIATLINQIPFKGSKVLMSLYRLAVIAECPGRQVTSGPSL